MRLWFPFLLSVRKVVPFLQPRDFREVVEWAEGGIREQEQFERKTEGQDAGNEHQTNIQVVNLINA